MPESLAEYVTRITQEKGLSGYDVERRSRKTITQSNVHRIANGQVLNPGTKTLKALAKGLSVPEHELFAVARGLHIGNADLANERLAAIDATYRQLSRTQKQRIDYLIEVLEREIVSTLGVEHTLSHGIPVSPTGSKITLNKITTQDKKQRRA